MEKQKRTLGMWSSICIYAAYGITLNTFAVGSAQSGKLTFWGGLMVIIIGWALTGLFGLLFGNIGWEQGMRSPAIFRAVFGKTGYKIPSVLATASLVGWAMFDYWYVGSAMTHLIPSLGSAAFYIGIVLIIVIAVIGCIKDITSLKWLTTLSMPISLGLFLVILFVTIKNGGGMAVLMNYQPPAVNTSLVLGVNVIVGCWLSSSCCFPDFSSSAKTRKIAMFAMPIGFLVTVLEYFVGQMGTYVYGIADFTSLAAALGGGMAIICNLFTLFAQGNTVPTCTLVMTNQLHSSLKVPRMVVIIAQPCLAGLLAIAMYLGSDLSIISNFASILGLIFAPICGIILAEYYVVGKRSFLAEEGLPKISAASAINLAVGFVLGVIFTYFVSVNIPTTIILAVFCFVLQIILRKGCKMK